jgi:hypothetical protein
VRPSSLADRPLPELSSPSEYSVPETALTELNCLIVIRSEGQKELKIPNLRPDIKVTLEVILLEYCGNFFVCRFNDVNSKY